MKKFVFDLQRFDIIQYGYDENGQPTQYVTTSGGQDQIYNNVHSKIINVRAVGANIDNAGNGAIINGSNANDIVYSHDSSNVVMNLNGGNDFVNNYSGNSEIYGGSGDDELNNVRAPNVLINTGEGYNTVANDGGNNILIYGGSQDDNISIYHGNSISIFGDGGNNVLTNSYASNVLISAADGDDTIFNDLTYFTPEEPVPNNVTINAGDGNNYINSGGKNVKIYSGKGNDDIFITGTEITVSTGEGQDTITNRGEYVTILADADTVGDQIINESNHTEIKLGGGNNSVTNNGSTLTINAGDGDDYISNIGDSVTISGGLGDNTIENYGKDNLILADSGNATIKNEGTNLTLQTGAENDSTGDFIRIVQGTVTVHTNTEETFESLSSTVGASNSLFLKLGNGNDTIQNTDSNVTVQVGDGDKTIENYGSDAVFIFGKGQQTLKNDGSGATITAAEDFNSDKDNTIVNEGEKAVIDCSKIKGVVLNGVDITDEENQVSTSDFNSIVSQMESEVQNFYQNIFSDNETLRSIFENDVNSPYLSFLNENSNSENAMLAAPSNNLVGYTVDKLIEKANKLTYLQQELIDGIGLTIDSFGLIKDADIANLEHLIPTADNLENLNKLASAKRMINNASASMTAVGGIITIGNLLATDKALKNSQNLYNSAVDNLLENYSPENLNNLKQQAADLEQMTDDAVLARASGGTFILSAALSLMPFVPPAGFVIGALFALNSAAGNPIENLAYKTGWNTKIGNSLSNFFGKPLDSHNKGINAKIIGGVYDDKIFNTGKYATIDSYFGNDAIINTGVHTEIYAGGGQDSIQNLADFVTINSGTGNDMIANFGGKTVVIDASQSDRAVIYNFGESVSLQATGDNDTIKNNADDVIINAFDGGEDYIVSGGDNVKIYAGNASDLISNSGDNVLIEAGEGNNVIDNAGDSTEINTGSGNDKIENHGDFVNVQAGSGNDSIENFGEDTKIYTSAGNDKVTNYSDRVTIDGSVGEDRLQNIGDYVLIETKDTQKDYIFNSGDNVTVNSSESDDIIINGGENVTINASTGKNVIQNLGNNVSISAGTEDLNLYGKDNFIFNDGDSVTILAESGGNDTIKSSGDNNKIFTSSGDDSIINQATNTTITAGSGNDSIENLGDSVTIKTEAGANVITNSGKNVSIITGDGDDSIENSGAGATIETGDGEDTIVNRGADTSIISADGNDTISNTAENVTINSGNGDDEIRSLANSVSIIAGEETDFISDDNFIYSKGNEIYISASKGKDTISVVGDKVEISSGAGEDLIENRATNSTINAGDDKDTVNNFVTSVTIDAWAGDDLITNDGEKSLIIAGEGDDSIENSAVHVTIEAGNGDDNINVSGENSKINLGSGKDSVENSGNFVSIEGSGDNQILNTGNNVIISVEKGNNSISNEGRQTTIISGNGEDSITNLESYVTIDTGVGNDIVTNSKENVYIESGSENDSISNSAALVTINAGIGDDIIDNIGTGSENVFINAGAGDDQIENAGNLVQVDLGTGNDTLRNFGNSVSIKGEGNNQIQNTGSGVEIYTAGGTNTITNSGEQTTIIGGNGADSITNRSSNVIINSGAGNDVIIIDGGSNSEITAGSGNDTLYSNGGRNAFNHLAGDGNDIIFGFSESDVLDIASANYTTVAGSDKNDVVVNTENGSITLKNVAGKKLNINGTLNVNYIAKINGLKNGVTDSDIYISGNVITLKKSALGTDEISLNDEEYTLALADDVEKAVTSEPTWKASGNTATYRTVTSKGYSVSADGKKITYSPTYVEGEPIIEISGLREGFSLSDISLNGKVVTLNQDSLGTDEIVIIGEGYTLALANDVDNVKNLDASWSVINGTATYKGGESAGYSVVGNKIIYSAAVDGESIISITGLSINATVNDISLKEGTLSLFAPAIGDETIVIEKLNGVSKISAGKAGNFIIGTQTFTTGAAVDFVVGENTKVVSVQLADAVNGSITNANGNISIYGGTGNDAITNSGNNVTISGGDGNDTITGDGADVIYQYDSGDGNDVIIGFTDSDTLLVDGTQYRARTINEDFIVNVAEDANTIAAKDKATFIIADSKVVSVDGFAAISGLSNATVHAIGNVAVNNSDIDVTGDNDFNVIVADSKVTGLANISAGASVEVANVNVTTDNNGDFKVGENVYTINDADGSVTFITNSNGEVSDVTNFSGTSRNVTVNGAAFTTNDTAVTISSDGSNITRIDGVGSGDVLSGEIDSATIVVTVASAYDTALWQINSKTYMLTGDADGVQITGNRIDGLDKAASLEVGVADTYIVNNTPLETKIGDTIIGTAEGSAYIFDPKNAPLNVDTMADDEISAQVGISTEYSTSEMDTEKSAILLEDASKLNGNMELALSNSDTTTAQTADFTNSTGKKKVTLAEGSQAVKFNDEGGNVAVIDTDSEGEKNITLGNGGDLAIVKGTATPVNITAGTGKDTIVTAGNNVTVDLKGGATKIVPNGGNFNLTNYDAATGAGIQIDGVSDIERALQNGNIELNNEAVSFGGSTVNLGTSENASTTVNLFDNKGNKQKVAYTHSEGGAIDATNEHENMLLVGNHNSNKSNGSKLTSGRGNDIALGGAGDYFDLGAGQNKVHLNSNRGSSATSATVAMTATEGKTEVSGFNSGFDDNSDKISINVLGANVSFKNGQLTFSVGNASLILNFTGSSADLAESADILIADNNFIGNDTQLDDITPITYEQGDYQNRYPLKTARDTLSSGVEITFSGQ